MAERPKATDWTTYKGADVDRANAPGLVGKIARILRCEPSVSCILTSF